MRISRDDMFLRVAEVIALRGTCPRATVGAVLVRHGRIISIGYNGAPSGMPHCEDEGCDVPFAGGGCVRAIHAETNAILWAAREGVSTDQTTMYCTHAPCVNCALTVAMAGITEFHYLYNYRDPGGLKILTDYDVAHWRRSGAGSVADAEDSESDAADRNSSNLSDGRGI